jgi:hypothetical protein
MGDHQTKGRPCGGPRCNETSGRPCQQASHQSVTMIIVRFMEVSLGYAQIQVNTKGRVNDDKGLSLGRIGPIRGDAPGFRTLGRSARPRAIIRRRSLITMRPSVANRTARGPTAIVRRLIASWAVRNGRLKASLYYRPIAASIGARVAAIARSKSSDISTSIWREIDVR